MDPIAKPTTGFRVFRDGRFQEPRTTYEALVDQGQKLKVAIFACSDSRVDPAIVLQADPGDLFIVRNVANLVIASATAPVPDSIRGPLHQWRAHPQHRPCPPTARPCRPPRPMTRNRRSSPSPTRAAAAA